VYVAKLFACVAKLCEKPCIAAIGALGGVATRASSIVNTINKRVSEKEANEIQDAHNKELEKIEREKIAKGSGLGEGLYISNGRGLYLTPSPNGDGFYLNI
jgi:hypothetical protein